MKFCPPRIVSTFASVISGFCPRVVLSSLKSVQLGVCRLEFCPSWESGRMTFFPHRIASTIGSVYS